MSRVGGETRNRFHPSLWESQYLAPYAMHSSQSRGRRYPEPPHPYRSPYQRDRDRIIHCAAFRRLSGKMQVFTGELGDYHRTRLTHTFEVAGIARTIGRALRLNEDLIEALALLHDIGHPPFGHAGEDALNECLEPWGGFSHNRFALTLAEELEHRYHDFPGLNLTWEVLEGQAIRAGDEAAVRSGPLLEVQAVEAADSITYNAHDTDDAIKLGLVRIEELAEVPLIRSLLETIRQRRPALPPALLRKTLVHDLIDVQVTDLIERGAAELERWRFPDAQAARKSPFRLGPSPSLAAQKAELERFLSERVYRHPQLLAVRAKAQKRLRALFQFFVRHPQLMPERFVARIEQVGLQRAVGDYLAGMTDRYCDEQCRRYGCGEG
ncbi:MAG: deoxyguanosinetriphosphate triphosphohydrolase-like protein [Pirellulaceae bacterium]|nr:MAG: deoxyguanosinetriphosphate triphosphohydrolase-like protein [Pirellulaceae bacterium]